ncbi:MAG TPA: hypothetical protein VFB06_10305 [Streptosporangiaceae bacterium]|nr:hypothetical protein [Streptosporangiaceae bacterium]
MRTHGPCRPLGLAAGPGRRVWPGARSLCLECSVRLPVQERTRSPVSNVEDFPIVEDQPW